VLDNYSPHLSTRDDPRVGQWAQANNVELAYVPTDASWLNRIEAQSAALRYFTLDGTDDASHAEQASMIRRYIAWRSRHAHDRRLGRITCLVGRSSSPDRQQLPRRAEDIGDRHSPALLGLSAGPADHGLDSGEHRD
jgi:hypothetical protein